MMKRLALLLFSLVGCSAGSCVLDLGSGYKLASVQLSTSTLTLPGSLTCAMDYTGSTNLPQKSSCAIRHETADEFNGCTATSPEGNVFTCEITFTDTYPVTGESYTQGRWIVNHVSSLNGADRTLARFDDLVSDGNTAEFTIGSGAGGSGGAGGTGGSGGSGGTGGSGGQALPAPVPDFSVTGTDPYAWSATQTQTVAPQGVTFSFHARIDTVSSDAGIAIGAVSPITTWSQNAILFRFSPSDEIEAYNGSGYQCSGTCPAYDSGFWYTFVVTANTVTGTYSATVEEYGSGNPVQIANNFAYRTSAGTVSNLRYTGAWAINGTTVEVDWVSWVPEACQPTTCIAEGYTCGTPDDGCGTPLNCGTCTGNDVCDTASYTCCTPLQAPGDCGGNCGLQPDGCGGTIDCGACAGTQCNNGVDDDGDGLIDWQYDLGCYGPNDGTEGGAPNGTIQNGWSVFEKSNDTVVIYVSATGNDSNNGLTELTPKRTLSAARNATRESFPDWILLKRGDTWPIGERIEARSGRSSSEPFIIATYGDSTERPIVRPGNTSALRMKDTDNAVVMGIHFYSASRNPSDPNFVGYSAINGSYETRGFYGTQTNNNILLEDNEFSYFISNLNEGGSASNFTMRRSLVHHNWGNDGQGHAQGWWFSGASITFQENIFYHNGWLQVCTATTGQEGGGCPKTNGTARVYNHNTYMANMSNLLFEENLFMSGSFNGNKFTSTGVGASSNMTFDNNLYVANDQGQSIGGNDNFGGRFVNINIVNNVYSHTGRERHLNRDFSTDLLIQDWNGGTIASNVIVQSGLSGYAGQAIGLNPDPTSTRNNNSITVRDNASYALGITAFEADDDENTNITISNNRLSTQPNSEIAAKVDDGLTGFTFSGNEWDSAIAAGSLFRVQETNRDLAWWQANVAASDSSGITFTDPTRNVLTYHTAQGGSGSLDDFANTMLQQSRYDWDIAYEIDTINDWIRAGYGVTQE